MTDLTPASAIPYVVSRTAGRYRRFVEADDITQTLWEYALGAGEKHLAKAAEAGEHFRYMRLLFGAARLFCEGEKAAQTGYDPDDPYHYSPEVLVDLIPLAFMANWDGQTGASGDAETSHVSRSTGYGGGLLAMVLDVRRALWAGALEGDFDPLTESGMENLERLCDRLGGERPHAPGYRRKAMSNAAAAARTQELTG